jgi:flagellar M-ring protein FliF
VNALFEQFRAFGAGRLTAIFGLTVGLAAALVYFSGSVGGGSQSLLYSALDPAEAAATAQLLDQNNIDYEIREGGTAIYVARDQVDEARVRVASGGSLSGASVGYEIFDESDSFGQTSFVQNLNAKRALEGELARSIQFLSAIDSARVHLNLPERRLFERDSQSRTAAITVSTRGRLSGEQIRVIRNLVSTAAGIEANNIAIADDRGRQLSSASGTESSTSAFMDERRSAIEAELRQDILDIVEGVVGPGSARVQVSADLDRQSITRSSERYDPEGSVLASQHTSEGESSDSSGGRNNRVSASENLPDAGDDAGAAGPDNASSNSTSEQTRNFALSSTTETHVIEAGAISRLSVAVAVDGVLDTLEDGTTQWRERSAEEIQEIEDLVRSAMGFDQAREDSLTVRQVEFARLDPLLGTAATSPFSFSKSDIMRVAEIAVLFITAMLVIFLVARPLVKGASGVAMPQGLALANAGAGAGAGVAQLDGAPAPTALPGGAAAPEGLPAPAAGATDGIDILKIDGQVKASSVKKVANIVEQHPEESISILRTWLHDS